MDAIIEFEVTVGADGENMRAFLASKQVDIPGVPQKGNWFKLPMGVRGKCNNCFWTYAKGGSVSLLIGLGSLAVRDFDGFYRELKREGFELTDRQSL